MAGGFIKLNRAIEDHWLCDDKPFDMFHAWVDLLMLASWKSGPRPWKGGIVEVNRGDVLTSAKALAERWGWSEKKVRNFIGALISDGMVAKKRQSRGILLTIEKYTFYQGEGRTEGQSQGQSQGNHCPTIEERNKKGKEKRARAGIEDPAAALEEVEAVDPPDWFKEKVKDTFGGM